MSDDHRISRRQALLGASATIAATAALAAMRHEPRAGAATVPFEGVHQSGIDTPIQDFLTFGSFDVLGTTQELKELLATWSGTAKRLMAGQSAASDLPANYPPADTGETAGADAASLSITIGFGPSLFDGRFSFSDKRPPALIELPAFLGDQLDPSRSHGDLCVQACANDPVVAWHAVRNLARLGEGIVALRWLQSGSGRTSAAPSGETPRNLLGFKDGTNNIATNDPSAMNEHVWVARGDGPDWMTGGSYLVARRIRTRLEEWSSLSLIDQQRAIGRFRDSGAPLTGHAERDPLELSALDVFGQPIIPGSAHVRVASHQENDGVRILRRGYNFADGLDPVTGELDAGLMFICFQRDPRRQFVTIQNRLATSDALSRYVTHTASAIFACPPGTSGGGYVGETLFS